MGVQLHGVGETGTAVAEPPPEGSTAVDRRLQLSEWGDYHTPIAAVEPWLTPVVNGAMLSYARAASWLLHAHSPCGSAQRLDVARSPAPPPLPVLQARPCPITAATSCSASMRQSVTIWASHMKPLGEPYETSGQAI